MKEDEGSTSQKEALAEFGQPADIALASLEHIERYGDNPLLVYESVLREVKVVYAA